MYIKARSASGGTDERIFNDYFDSQYQMLKALKPPIVGHFDLIRLRSDNPDFNFLQWRCVKQSIIRNLDFIVGYGGVLELNSAALRKGMAEPYPAKAVCEVRLTESIIPWLYFDLLPSCFWIREEDLPLPMTRMAFRKLEEIMGCSCSSPRVLELPPLNGSRKCQSRERQDFQSSPVTPLAFRNSKVTIFSNSQLWILNLTNRLYRL